MKKLLLVIVLLPIAFSVFGATGWGGDRGITRIVHHDSGNIFIILEPLSPEPGPSCQNNSWLLLPSSHKAFEQMYSSALSALHSGKKLNGYIEGCTAVSGFTYRSIKRLDALP